ncbi:Uncharacterised protein [Escherichia coli]|nr:Uncharacterised protein [Escherichia coli]
MVGSIPPVSQQIRDTDISAPFRRGIGFIDGLIHTQQASVHRRGGPIIICRSISQLPHPAPIPIRAFRSGPAGSRYRRSGKPHDQERALNNTLSALPSLQHPERSPIFASHVSPSVVFTKVLRFPVSPFVFIQSLTICTQVVNGLYAVQM